MDLEGYTENGHVLFCGTKQAFEYTQREITNTRISDKVAPTSESGLRRRTYRKRDRNASHSTAATASFQILTYSPLVIFFSLKLVTS
jgi:hypothetical protein